MGRYIIATALAGLFISSLAVAASEAEKPPVAARLMGIFAPKTGAWSEYALFDNSTGKRTVMRMSIVGVENDSYWYEMIIKEGEGSKIVKMMVTGDPVDPENIKRLIVKSGSEPAVEMDMDSVQKVRMLVNRTFEQQIGLLPSGADGNMKDIETGAGVATVPAGTFEVNLHQIVDTAGIVYAEYKYSEDVRPFGIVSSESGNATIVLVGYGDGAKSLITEESVVVQRPTAEPDTTPMERKSDAMPPQNREPEPGFNIRQIPGMGTGYETKK